MYRVVSSCVCQGEISLYISMDMLHPSVLLCLHWVCVVLRILTLHVCKIFLGCELCLYFVCKVLFSMTQCALQL